MTIKNIMSQPVVWISPEATIEEAARTMMTNDIGDLPVCEGGKLIGIVTDRDIAVRGCSRGLNPSTTKVREIMTEGVEWCFNDDELNKIIKRMEKKGIQRMIVIDHNKKLIGVVSLADIAVRADEELAAEALHRISEVRRSRRMQEGSA